MISMPNALGFDGKPGGLKARGRRQGRDLVGIYKQCQNDPGSLRRHPGTPKELQGTIWNVSGAPQERPKSLSGTTRERPRANRHAEKIVEEHQDAR